MSNAMRTGKRWLAGVAAGALGAGMIALAAPQTAVADPGGATVAVEFEYPSVTVVGGGLTGTTDDTGIILPLLTLNSDGDDSPATLGTNKLQLSITAPATAARDDSVVLSLSDSSSGGFASTELFYLPSAPFKLYVLPAGSQKWGGVVSAGNQGTYTVRARLVSTVTGAVVSTATIPVNLISSATPANPATLGFLNSDGNPINAYGSSMGATVATLVGFAADSAGGPYIAKAGPSVTSTNTTTTTTWTTTNGFDETAGAQGAYAYVPSSNTWSTSQPAASVTAQFNGSSAVLPVSLGSINTGVTNTVALTTLPQSTVYKLSGTNVAVPTGTTALSFQVDASTFSSTTRTMGWNVGLSGTGASVASGGAVAISGNTGTISLNVSPGATQADDTLRIVVGDFTTPATTTYQVSWQDPAPYVTVPNSIGKVASATPIAGTFLTQFGATVPNGPWAVSLKTSTASCTSATSLATGTVNADGTFEVTAPASAAPTVATDAQFKVCVSNGVGTPISGTTTVTYTSTGGVTSLTTATLPVSSSGITIPVVNLPSSGIVPLDNPNLTTQTAVLPTSSTNPTQAVIDAAAPALEVAATVAPTTAAVTFTASEGAFVTSSTTGSIAWNAGKSTVTISPTSGTSTASVYATKPGLHTITVTAGSTSRTVQFYAGVASNSARTVTAEKASVDMGVQEFVELKASLKDVFGNPVPDDTILVSLAGGGTIGTAPVIITTNANGVGSVYYTSGTAVGRAILTFSANVVTATIGGGAPAAKVSDTTTINVGSAPTIKTLVIVGERGTVSGKPGILVDGSSTGFVGGAKVKPWIRFPGQSEYTAGSARPQISLGGDFSWQRKTGKKTYVFFTSEDDAVKSNRVIIAAN